MVTFTHPHPGMHIEKARTALVVADIQNDAANTAIAPIQSHLISSIGFDQLATLRIAQ